MPRKVKDPIVSVMQYFETASIESARTALEVVTEIVSRRSFTQKKLVERKAKVVEPTTPLRSRAEEAVTEPNPLDPKPKARVRTGKAARPMQITSPDQIVGGLPGPVATVGE